eukprot:2716510-Prymnesium_polylepis.3
MSFGGSQVCSLTQLTSSPGSSPVPPGPQLSTDDTRATARVGGVGLRGTTCVSRPKPCVMH